ncbi:MAG: carbohydrate-binding domain-containing protein [Solobacterium sp.]|nr:carbohydrate-binding domain-containing protein [Solobacterium sp.]
MKTRNYLAVVLTVFLAAGCTQASAAVNEKTITVSAESVVNMKFTEDELNETYDDATAVHIRLNGSDVTADGDGAVCEDTSITITKGGTYVVSGSWEEGQIIVDSEDDTIVHLVLNNVSIESTGGPAVYVKNAEETVLTVLTGTTNTISTSGENADEKKGGIYAKDDLAVNGGGNLDINAKDGDGIHAGDELKLINTIVTIQADSDGMDVNDGLAVKDCILTVKAGKDGIKAGDTDDNGTDIPADIEISGGVIKITAEDDGIQTTGNLTAENCELNTEAGGGYENAQAHKNEMPNGMFSGFDNENRPESNFGSSFPQGRPGEWQEGSEGESEKERPGFGMMPEMNGDWPEMDGEMPSMNGERPEMNGEMPEMNGMFQEGQEENNASSDTDTDESETSSGIKADGSILLSGTTISINSADDAINTNGDLTINSGTYTILAGDDGMHADEQMTIHSGEITMDSCYEGLEAKNLTIDDGTIVINASDDGINTRDGDSNAGEFHDDGSMLTINGGSVTVTADGDGIDCNGSGVMNGGSMIVYGPVSGANSALDYNGTFVINSGTLIAAGSSGMATAPSASSKVNIIEIGITNSSGKIEVKDNSGKTVAEFESDRAFGDLVIATEAFKTGSIYTVTQGSETIGEVTISDTVSYVNRTAGSGMSGGQRPGGFQDGNREQWNGNNKPDMQQKPDSGSDAGDGSEDSGTSEGFSETKPL